MKILSLWQPHASAMALGLKLIETRSWPTAYRGLVAIHAAKKWDQEIKEIIGDIPQEFRRRLDAYWESGFGYNFPLGEIVAVGELVTCQSTRTVFAGFPSLDTPMERAFGNYEPGRYGWVFRNVRPLPQPWPFKGGQGLRNLDEQTRTIVLERAGVSSNVHPVDISKGGMN